MRTHTHTPDVDDTDDPVRVALRELFVEAHLTQEKVAAALGTKQQYVSRWLTSQRPTLEQIQAIEKFAGVPVGRVLRRAGFVADVVDAGAAILSDPALDGAAKEMLVSSYRYALEVAAKKAPAKRQK